jgi:hypothetical protein
LRGGTIAAGSTAPQTTAPAPTPDSEYGSLLRDFTIDDFHKDPAYDFTLSEGQKALDRSAAAKGVLGSGTYLKDLTKYNQDFANTKYDESFNRFNNNRDEIQLSRRTSGIRPANGAPSRTVGAQYAGINSGLSAMRTRMRQGSGHQDMQGWQARSP